MLLGILLWFNFACPEYPLSCLNHHHILDRPHCLDPNLIAVVHPEILYQRVLLQLMMCFNHGNWILFWNSILVFCVSNPDCNLHFCVWICRFVYCYTKRFVFRDYVLEYFVRRRWLVDPSFVLNHFDFYTSYNVAFFGHADMNLSRSGLICSVNSIKVCRELWKLLKSSLISWFLGQFE